MGNKNKSSKSYLTNYDIKCCGFFIPSHQLKLRQTIQKLYGDFLNNQSGHNSSINQQIKVMYANDNDLAKIISSKSLHQNLIFRNKVQTQENFTSPNQKKSHNNSKDTVMRHKSAR